MYRGEFEELFKGISQNFTLANIAKPIPIQGKLLKASPTMQLWEMIDTMQNYDGIDIGKGKYVSKEYFFRKPVRILFFILIHELESRLYRIQRWFGKDLQELDRMNINDLIRELANNETLISLQRIYNSRVDFKEDLKAISAFRNIIVHTNRMLLKSIDVGTLIKRKKQVLTLLEAVQQILDNMERKSFE